MALDIGNCAYKINANFSYVGILVFSYQIGKNPNNG